MHLRHVAHHDACRWSAIDDRNFFASRCTYSVTLANSTWAVDFGVEASDAARDAVADAFAGGLPSELFVDRCGETAV